MYTFTGFSHAFRVRLHDFWIFMRDHASKNFRILSMGSDCVLKNSIGCSKVLVSNYYNLLRTWYWMQLVLYSPVASLTLAAMLLPIICFRIFWYAISYIQGSSTIFLEKGPKTEPPEQVELFLLARSHCSLNDSSTCSCTSRNETYKKNKRTKIAPTLRT